MAVIGCSVGNAIIIFVGFVERKCKLIIIIDCGRFVEDGNHYLVIFMEYFLNLKKLIKLS